MKKIFSILIILLILSGSGCKSFLDINIDPNNPLNVQEALLLSPCELSISRNLMSGNAAWICQNFMQMSALNQPNPQVGTYRLLHSDVDGDWTSAYSDELINLNIMINKAEKDGNFHYAAIGKILTAFTVGTTTDLWGDIPYSQALLGTGNLLPVYDKQEDIYNSIQSLLDDGIADIAKTSKMEPGSDDYFYQGNMAQWQKVAYTLKARYAMHLTKAPGHTASAQADLALNFLASGMLSNDDNLTLLYPGTPGQESGWWINFNPGSTSCMSAFFVDSLVARNDPRLPFIVSPAEDTGLYTGRVIGTDAGVLTTYSSPTDLYGGIGASNDILTYQEALFLQAEATLIKSGAAAAEPIYQAGIQSHMSKLGVAAADVTPYLATRGSLTSANVNALQRIMEEKNVANFLNIEVFTDWRRTGFPALTSVPDALSAIPRRLIYPQVELIRNPQPQQVAKIIDRVWWDQQ